MTELLSSDTKTAWPSKYRGLDDRTVNDNPEATTDFDFLRIMASDFVMDGERTEEDLRKLFGAYKDIQGFKGDYAEFQHNFDSLAHLYDMANDFVQTSQSEEQAPPSIFQAFIYLQEDGVGDLADPFAKNVLLYHLYDNGDKSGISRYILENPPEGYTEEVVYEEFRDRKEIARKKAEEIQRASEEAAVEAANKRWGEIVLANTSHFL